MPNILLILIWCFCESGGGRFGVRFYAVQHRMLSLGKGRAMVSFSHFSAKSEFELFIVAGEASGVTEAMATLESLQ